MPKSIKQLITDEQRRTAKADDQLRCFAINTFGGGQHPYADETTLAYFKAPFISECLLKCAQNEYIRPHARQRAKELAHSFEPHAPFCSCGQDTVTCQGCGKLCCGNTVVSYAKLPGRAYGGNVGPCCLKP